MSFAETYSAATASIVVSPATTGTSCIEPQVVGVIVPENEPVPVAPAAPAKSVSSATMRMPPITSPGRSFICVPPGVGDLPAGPIPGGVANRTSLTDGSVGARLRRGPQAARVKSRSDEREANHVAPALERQ